MLDNLMDLPEVKGYLNHCIKEHLSTYMSDKHAPQENEMSMTDTVKDDVNIHNIIKGLGDHGGGGGLGMGGLGAGLIGGVLGGLLFNRRGGFGGDGGDCGGGGLTPGQAAFDQTILTGVMNIPAQISAAQNATQTAIGALALADQGGFANVKDAVQNLALFISNQLNTVNQNVSEQGCKTREVTQAGTTAVLQAIAASELATLRSELAESNHNRRATEANLTVTQTVSTVQAQAQQQQQQQRQDDRSARIEALLAGVVQIAHATNQNVIAGNTGAVTTGAQSANPVNVAT